MNQIPLSNVRSFVLVGHTGSGKTAITDALAYKLGLNDRLGSTANGSSVSDFTEEEKNRKISLFATTFHADYKAGDQTYSLFFSDAPGYMDFYGQLLTAVRASDTAIVVVDSGSGVQVGTWRGWHCADKQGVAARSIAVTGLDKENTDYAKTVAALREAFGNKCIPVAFPSDDKKTLVPLFSDSIPAAFSSLAGEVKDQLVELAAEQSEDLMNKYFENGELSPEDLKAGLRLAALSGAFVPILPVFPLSGVGVQELLDATVEYFADPTQRKRIDAEGNEIKADPNGPFFALVWHTVSDSFTGLMSHIRVLSGTLKPGMEIDNARTGKDTAGSILIPLGTKTAPAQEATPGDIVAIPKLRATTVGDTLRAPGTTLQAAPIELPTPVAFAAVRAVSQSDDDKLGTALQKVLDCFPSIKVERNAETHETVIKALGDVHLDVAAKLMKQLANVNVTLSTPQVAYHETINGTGEGHHRHKKQSGGRGQFGEVYMKVEPLPEGETDWFVDETVGGSIPGNFMPAIQKGCVERMLRGPVAGYKVVGVKVRIYDGSFHPVDSSEIAFKIAGSGALKDAMMKAKPVLLEPIMSVRVTIPDQFMGAVNGDLTHKRGRVLGIEAEDGMQVIQADVPEAELVRYSAELRSLTGGQGTFSMEFSRYETVPGNVAQKVIADSPYNKQSEEE